MPPIESVVVALIVVAIVCGAWMLLARGAPDEEAISARPAPQPKVEPAPPPVEVRTLEQLGAREVESADDGDDHTPYDGAA